MVLNLFQRREYRAYDEQEGNERPYHKRAVHTRVEHQEGSEHRLPPFESVERGVLAIGIGHNLFVAAGVGNSVVRAARKHLRKHYCEDDQHQHYGHRGYDGFL